MRPTRLLLPMLLILSLSACASVPREVVELSYAMGADLDEVQRTHEALIRLHFDDLRRRTDDFLVTEWQPTYLRRFIQEGELVALATDPDPNEVLGGVQDWTEVAIEEIQAKRHELLDPLDVQEQDLLETVGAAFARLRTANATITAHLSSIRAVDEAQGDALARLGLGDLRGQITAGLAEASRITEDGIRATIEADSLLDKAALLRERIRR